MTARAPVFDQIIMEYLLQVANLDHRDRLGEVLGITLVDKEIRIPFFHRLFTIANDRIVDDQGIAPSHATSVVLCKYLLLCPALPDEDRTLCTYKDFKNAAPYVGGFRNTAQRPIAAHFEGRIELLERACRQLGGRPFDTDVACQLAFHFQGLPRVPVFLLFNDADEDFEAQCTLLFHKSVASYLDMECIAMVGMTLASKLRSVS